MRLILGSLTLVLAGCATASQEDRDSLLAEPIDCAVAEDDIAALEAAKPSRRERTLSAAQTATPIGVVASVIRGSYRDRAAVLVGRTESELSARIDEIEQTCGLSDET